MTRAELECWAWRGWVSRVTKQFRQLRSRGSPSFTHWSPEQCEHAAMKLVLAYPGIFGTFGQLDNISKLC